MGFSPNWKKLLGSSLEIFVLAFSIWFLFPLLFSSTFPIASAKIYFYRTVVGLVILIILFGKTVTDLLFPQGLARYISNLKSVFLIIYSFLLASGILYIAGKLIVVYFRNSQSSLDF